MYELMILLLITLFEIMLFIFGSKFIGHGIKDTSQSDDLNTENKERIIFNTGIKKPGL